MAAVGEIIGISVGLGICALAVVYASVLSWNAEDRKAKAQRRFVQVQQEQTLEGKLELDRKLMQQGNSAIPLTLKADQLPIGRVVDIESGWGQLGKQVQLKQAKMSVMKTEAGEKTVVTLQVVGKDGLPRSIGPLLVDPASGELVGVKLKVYA